MDAKTAAIIGMAISIGLASIGPGIGMGMIFSSYMNSVTRQPEVENKIKPFLFMGLGIIEALTIYALVIVLFLLATQVLGK